MRDHQFQDDDRTESQPKATTELLSLNRRKALQLLAAGGMFGFSSGSSVGQEKDSEETASGWGARVNFAGKATHLQTPEFDEEKEVLIGSSHSLELIGISKDGYGNPYSETIFDNGAWQFTFRVENIGCSLASLKPWDRWLLGDIAPPGGWGVANPYSKLRDFISVKAPRPDIAEKKSRCDFGRGPKRS